MSFNAQHNVEIANMGLGIAFQSTRVLCRLRWLMVQDDFGRIFSQWCLHFVIGDKLHDCYVYLNDFILLLHQGLTLPKRPIHCKFFLEL